MDELNCYWTPPQREFKAAQELERANIPFELLTETITTQRAGSAKPVERTVPVMRSYLPAESKPANAKYIGRSIGRVKRSELIRCVTTMDRIQQRRAKSLSPFSIGQAVRLGEIPAVVAATDGELCTVAFEMCGKQHFKTLHYDQLHPG